MTLLERISRSWGNSPAPPPPPIDHSRYGGHLLGVQEYVLGDQSPQDGIGIGLTGVTTRGAGVLTYIDEDGNPQVIPVTESSFANGWLWEATDLTETGGAFEELGLQPYVIDPPINSQGEEDLLHNQIHSPVPPLVRVQHVVNPENPGVPNLGPLHEQPAFTSRSQVVQHVDSEEQGYMMEGRIAEDRFPLVQDPNPFYNWWIWRRNGALNFSSEGVPFGRVTNEKVQAIEEMRRNRSSVHQRVVDNPGAVYFSETVPVEGQAGPVPEPIDVNDMAIY